MRAPSPIGAAELDGHHSVKPAALALRPVQICPPRRPRSVLAETSSACRVPDRSP
jgi:hypothetical protein